MGVASFSANATSGNVVGAAIDAVGVVVDAAAITPFVPGGAGAGIKAAQAGLNATGGAGDAAKAVGSAGGAASVAISMDKALDKADAFMDLGTDIKSVDGANGVQFIQQGTDAAGDAITKRVGFDVNPNSSHVQKIGPHLNLETQRSGNIVKRGPGADPHIPIDSNTVRLGDF